MTENSVARAGRYVLYRVHESGAETFVSEHPTFEEGWSEGQHAVYVDRAGAYALYFGHRRVARFGSSRHMVRNSNIDVIFNLV